MTEGLDKFLEDMTSPAPAKIKMSEAIIQGLLYRDKAALFPNITIGCNEWDAVAVSKAMYVTCFEIKISKSDFKRDADKERHPLLLERKAGGIGPRGYKISLGLLPKYVYYVIHGFELQPEEIPDYAGLMVVGEYGLTIQKQAPVLWKEKISDKHYKRLYEIMANRYIYNTGDRNMRRYLEWGRNH